MIRPRRTWVVAAVVLVTLLSSACTGPPDGPPTPTGPPSAGAVPFDPAAHPLGAKWVWAQYDKVKPYLADLQGGNTYVEVVLCDVQPTPGSFDWSVPDSQVSRARAVGFGSLVKLRTGRCWATPGATKYARGQGVTESAMPGDMAVYTDFVDRAVRRYSDLGVTEFAVENEVNSPFFWDGTPQEYATVSRAAAKAIRAAAPEAVVVDGSVSSAGAGFAVAAGLLDAGQESEAVTFYRTYYERRFGTREGAASIDDVTSPADLRTQLARPGPKAAIDFLRAIDALLTEGVFQARQVHFYETWQSLPATLGHLRARTPQDVDLEMWELGLWDDDRSVPPDQRTAEVVKSTVIALAAGVTKVLWLPLLDNPDGRLAATLYGLVTPAGESRGTAHAFALLSKAVAQHAEVEKIENGELMGAAFAAERPTMVAWSTTGDEVSIGALPDAAGTLLDDSTTPTVNGPAMKSVGTQPVLITTTGPMSVFKEIAG